jgi:phosphoglycolate phosphatase
LTSVEAVILDVDGTVATCPYDFEAMRAAVAEVAGRWGAGGEGLKVRGVIERMEAVARELGEAGEAFLAEAERAVVEVEMAGASCSRLLPGAAEALCGLRAEGARIALVTRNCRAATERVVAGLDCYEVLLTREDVPQVKPDPDHIVRAATALGCAVARSAVVGDHIFDMQAGRAAGVRFCIGVTTGSSSRKELLGAGADMVAEGLGEARSWLLGQVEGRR